MEEKLEDKTNNELLFDIKQLEADHEALKTKLINDYDKLVDIENKFDRINENYLKDLKGE